MNQKEIKKITSLTHSKYREKYGVFLAEGPHPVAELLKSEWPIESIVISEDESRSGYYRQILAAAHNRKAAVEIVDRKIFDKLSTTETPQGIMAVAKIPQMSLHNLLSIKNILVADGIADPGNLGTIVRTAVAFGFDGIVTTSGTADIYSPKVVRASQGALFQLTVVQHRHADEIIERLSGGHIFYALDTHSIKDINNIEIAGNLALIVGAEINGVDDKFLKSAKYRIRIPIDEKVESLNAAMAAGIAMYILVSKAHPG